MKAWERVQLLFSTGTKALKPAEELRLDELLLANRLPPSLFQAYEVPGDGSLRPLPITTRIEDIPEENKILIQCIRNTDENSFRAGEYEVVQHGGDPVTSLFDFRYGGSEPHSKVHLLDEQSARETVFSKIASFLEEEQISTPMVAGISGGGDSNTLVQGLLQHLKQKGSDPSEITCFTLVMDPLWPASAARRAQALCEDAGFRNMTVSSEKAMDLLGMERPPEELWKKFSDRYGSDTSHFFGTFFVSLVGREICKTRESENLLLGYNREDVFAELLFFLTNGRKPLQFPVRKMGAVNCVLPVWDIPKTLLDACYPKYSESNYSERIDTTTAQRSAIYFLAHCLDGLSPQSSLSIMQGIRALMNDLDGWEKLESVQGTPLFKTGQIEDPQNHEAVEMTKGFFPSWDIRVQGKGKDA